jgi:hypothetical protein
LPCNTHRRHSNSRGVNGAFTELAAIRPPSTRHRWWAYRGLKAAAYAAIANNDFNDIERDVSPHLNNWMAIT